MRDAAPARFVRFGVVIAPGRLARAVLAAAILPAAAATVALAQTPTLEESLTACAAIGAVAQRRQCLDDLLVRFGYREATPEAVVPPPQATGPATSPVSYGAWRYRAETSRFDGSTTIALRLPARDLVRDRFGRTFRFELAVLCEQGTTQFVIGLDGLALPAREATAITWRVDSRPPATATMQRSPDGRSLGLWTDETAVPLVETLFGGETLYIEVTPPGEQRMQAVFPIAALEQAIVPLREACGW